MKKPSKRYLTSCFLSFLWCLTFLAVLNPLAVYFDFWSFQFHGGAFYSVPVDIIFAWAVLWSVIPSLLSEKINIFIWVSILFLFDILYMPLLHPLLQLGEYWIFFDWVGLGLVFIPSRLLFLWTLYNKKLYLRACLQFILFSVVSIIIIPMIMFENLNQVEPMATEIKSWSFVKWGSYLTLLLFAGTLGISGLQEFAIRGRGTPLPFDPPNKLITTGPYAYIKHPMKMTMILTYLALSLILKNSFIAIFGIPLVLCYAVFSYWDEGVDLDRRFGKHWKTYLQHVPGFIPRFQAWREHEAEIYIDYNHCGSCAIVHRVLKKLKPQKLMIQPAENYHFGTIIRVTYRDKDGFEATGVSALGRALEHIHFFWALLGFFIRLPVISHLIQNIIDLLFPPHKVRGK